MVSVTLFFLMRKQDISKTNIYVFLIINVKQICSNARNKLFLTLGSFQKIQDFFQKIQDTQINHIHTLQMLNRKQFKFIMNNEFFQ